MEARLQPHIHDRMNVSKKSCILVLLRRISGDGVMFFIHVIPSLSGGMLLKENLISLC